MGCLLVVVVVMALAVLAPLAGTDSRGLTDRHGGPPDLLPPEVAPDSLPPEGARDLPGSGAAPDLPVSGAAPDLPGPDRFSTPGVLPSAIAFGTSRGRHGCAGCAPGRACGGRPLTARLAQLYAGLVLYGVSMAFFVQARLGVMPWDVLHQGLAQRLPLTLGQMSIVVAVVVLLAWIPLRQRPGLGTVSNVFVIGLVVDAALAVLPAPMALGWRVAFLASGVALNGVATAAYIGARMGPGPRDGLMTGLVARTGLPVRRIRTSIEVSVVVVGWLLGGNLGVGTVLYALAIGPLVQPLLPLLDSERRGPAAARRAAAKPGARRAVSAAGNRDRISGARGGADVA